nr:hypothetical protein [Tanacetum cinerariifolium]
MDACVFKKIGPPKKSYCNDFYMDEMVDWVEMEVEQHSGSSQHPQKPKGVETKTSNIDKGVEARTSTTKGVEARTSTTDKRKENVNKLVDYLSPGEEELIKLRNWMIAGREAKAKAKGNPVSKMNEPNVENSMHADNVRGDTFEEYDIYMNELL